MRPGHYAGGRGHGGPTDGRRRAWRGHLEPDADSPWFTLAVMPDTQFLYWGTQGSINPEPQEESFRYILANNGKAPSATSSSWPTSVT